MGLWQDNDNNIFINGNLIADNSFNIGSIDNRWGDIFTKKLVTNDLNATDISGINIYTDKIETSTVESENIYSTTINATDISSTNLNVKKIKALFDISANSFYGESIRINDIDGKKIIVNEITTDNSENDIIVKSNLIPDNSYNTIGSEDNSWTSAFINDITIDTIKTNAIDDNISVEGHLLPNDDKNIGSKDKSWKNAYIKDVSFNKIGSLNDSSKNIIVDGNLIPNGPYSDNKTSEFSLGEKDKRWKDLYLSGSAFYIGDASISIRETINDDIKTVELVFTPNIEEPESTSITENPTITLGRGDFKIINNNNTEVLQPIEGSFSTASLVTLNDVDISQNELSNGDMIVYNAETNKFVIGEGGNTVNLSDQTLLDVISEQPQKFNDVSRNNTSGEITLEWNYDDILVKYDDDTHRLLTNTTSLKDKMLPYIDKIHVDISGTIHGITPPHISNNTWIPFYAGDYDINGNRTINLNDSYNSDPYKILKIYKTQPENLNSSSTLTERILSQPGSLISFRIYGINNSKDSADMQNTRALYFNNIIFKFAETPKRPSYINDQIVSNGINLTSVTEETEEGNAESTAIIIRANVNYNEVERLISTTPLLNGSPYQVNTNSIVETFTFNTINNTIQNNTIFDLLLDNNIRPGTRYKYNLTLTNNLVNTESDSLEKTSTLFTQAPPSIHPTTLEFSVSNSYKTYIVSDTLNSSNRIYVNLGDSNTSKVVILPEVNNETIEISSDFRLGRNLDVTNISDGLNLSVINVYINSTHKQTVNFNGYDVTSDAVNFDNIQNLLTLPNAFNFISRDTLQDDMYNDILLENYQNKMGFRLKANIFLSEIKISDVRSSISNNTPRISPYVLKFEYIRKGKLYENQQDVITSNSFNIYVDRLSINPTISTIINPAITITNLIYNMGIPTVHKFNIVFDTTNNNSSRAYSNINSEFKFFRGDLKISDIQITGDPTSKNINKTNVKDILLSNRLDISTNGIYNLSHTNFQSSIANYYTGVQYTAPILGSNNKLKFIENVFSLKTDDSGITGNSSNLIVNHFCDRNSFENFPNTTPSHKVTNEICEIENINVFSSNMANLTVSLYTNHTTLVRDSTLLFIDGIFQSHGSLSYPVVGGFSYQGQTLANGGYTNNMAQTAYGLDGTADSTDKKYKWIGFRFSGTKDGNGEFDFVNYTGDSTFIDIYDLLRKYFKETTFNKLIDNNDDDVIGFVKVNNAIGNLSRSFNKLSPWYGISSESSLSNIFLNSNKGANLLNSSSSWGPVISTSTDTLTVFIFIGLNNAEVL